MRRGPRAAYRPLLRLGGVCVPPVRCALQDVYLYGGGPEILEPQE